jgi:hypothetical protein
MFIIIRLFVQLFVWVGILFVHYNNADRPVICVGWEQPYYNEHIKYQPTHITGRTALL